MKWYEIMVALIIFNLWVNIVNVVSNENDWGMPTIAKMDTIPEGNIPDNINQEKTSLETIQQNIIPLGFGSTILPLITPLLTLISIFINSSFWTWGTYYQLVCTWGESCSQGSSLWLIVSAMWLMTTFVYLMGIIQLKTGRDLRSGE